MRRVVRIIGIILGVLVVIILIAAVVVYFLSNSKLNETYTVEAEAISISDDPDVIARGEYLVLSLVGCAECHGDDLGGDTLIDDAVLGKIYAPNLTSGEGGIGGEFSDADWVRAVRHGVGDEGEGLFIMPAGDFHNFTEADLTAVISYVKSVPPVDRENQNHSLRLARLLILLDTEGLIPAAGIDHDAPFRDPLEPEVSEEYGGYLASLSCIGCHGENLSGRPGEPGFPEYPNLTPGGVLPDYTEESFFEVLRTGVTADERTLDPDYMPWTVFAHLTDEDIQALWLYLQSLPATDFNS